MVPILWATLYILKLLAHRSSVAVNDKLTNLIAIRPHILDTRDPLSHDEQHDVQFDARVGWSAVARLEIQEGV